MGEQADRRTWAIEHCSIALTLDAIGARSSFLILREALYGTTRFDDFVRFTRTAAPNVAARLRRLTELGLFTKHPYRDEGQRTRDEYLLTEKGKDLLPALFALLLWGDKYLQPDGRAPVRLVERATGGPVRIVARGSSDVDLGWDDIAIVANGD